MSSIGNLKVLQKSVNVDFLTAKKNPRDSQTPLFGSINEHGLERFSAHAIEKVKDEVQSGWKLFLNKRGSVDAWISCSDGLYVPSFSLDEIKNHFFFT